jgi:parvulin-like peptidyl-prolyl isomerase
MMRHDRTAALGRFRGSALVIGALVTALALFGVGCSSEEEQEESPLNKLPLEAAVVKIGDMEITGAWLRNWCVTQQLQIEKSKTPLQPDAYSLIRNGREMLTKMVIVAREAKRRGLEVSEQQVQDRLAQEMGRFDSTEKWLDVLEKSGLTREQRKEQIRLELLFAEYEKQVLEPKIEQEILTEENVREFYEKYKDQGFQRPHGVQALHIMRSVPRDAPEQERQREREIIREARERVEQGEAFEDVAREISSDQSAIEGGDIGWVTAAKKEMPDDLREAVLELSEGEMTPVLESPHGLHLFKAKDVQEAGTIPFEDMREDIRARMKGEAMSNRMAQHVSQLREQLIQAKKLQYLNLTPYLGRSLTPKEAQQAQQAQQAGQSQGSGGAATGGSGAPE